MLLERIAGTHDFDPRCLVPVAKNEQTAEGVLALLRRHGAPAHCYLIARDSKLDRTTAKLEDVLRNLVGQCETVLVSCIPGRRGYLGTESGDRCLLRPAGKSRAVD